MNILLYAPSLPGHPQVYCRVIGDLLLEAGHRVVIAAGLGAEDWPARWRDLRPFVDHPRVQMVNTAARSRMEQPHLTAEELKQLQEDFAIESTLLVEADHFASQLRRMAAGEAPRLKGWNVGIFARTSDWYPREDDYGGAPRPRLFGGGIRPALRRGRQLLWRRRESSAYLFNEILRRRRFLDAIVVKDERTPERFGPPVYWMPEIYRVFDVRPEERRRSDWETWALPIREYFQRAGPDNILLFFGTGSWYKGYDFFLRLAERVPTIYALHAGAPEHREPNKPMAYDTSAIRERLRREGRLLETGAFVESADLIALIFEGIGRFVSTHRLTLSSGTALQALEFGKPVLTPAGGLVGYRTRTFHLGLTYRYFDEEDLVARWREFRELPPEEYAASIRAFMRRFGREEVARCFRSLLCEGRAP